MHGDYKEADEIYNDHKQKSLLNEHKELYKNVFGFTLLPSIKNRRQIMNNLENLLDFMIMHGGNNELLKQSFIPNHYDTQTD